MARDFVPSTDLVNLGDVTAARFLDASAWTALTFLKVDDTNDGDEDSIITKDEGGVTRQILWRVTDGTSPQHIEVWDRQSGGARLSGSDGVSSGVWYCCAVVNDPGTILIYTFDLDGTAVDDGASTTDFIDVGELTAPIRLGNRRSTFDELDGKMAFTSYFSRTFSRADFLDYMHNPWRVLSRYFADCEFFLEMGRTSGGAEVDFSGNGNTGTITGTTIVDNPPFGGRSDPFIFPVAVAGGLSIPVAMYNYRRRRI